MPGKVAVVGSCMTDFITYSLRLPKPGETLVGNTFEQGFGGKGANQCVSAARLGAETIFVASLGEDSLGKEYLANLTKENVDTSHIKLRKGIHSGVAQITVTETGENCIIIVPGSNTLLSPEDVHEAKEKIQSAAVLICQFETPLHTTIEALKVHKGHGVSIVNCAPAVENVDVQILKLADILCINETEAEIITGIQNVTVANAQKVVDKLFSLGCNTVIITFGSQGAVHASKESKNIVHTPGEVVKAIDTTGAGDSFLGALAYYIACHPDLPLQECITRANKIAAKSVLKTGTQSSYLYRKDLPAELF